MANKKQLLSGLNEETAKIENIQKYFTESTETPEQPQPKEEKAKRSYTHFTYRDKKTHTVTLRLTDKQFNNLVKQVEKTDSVTISNYITKLIEKGL